MSDHESDITYRELLAMKECLDQAYRARVVRWTSGEDEMELVARIRDVEAALGAARMKAGDPNVRSG